MGKLFGRQYKLTILTYRGDSIVINSDLRMTFQIEKCIPALYQFGTITLYNLNKDTETDIFKNGKSVTLEAGYQNGPYGIIFQGAIRQPIRGKEDAVTYFLRLVCLDGDDNLQLGFCNLVVAGGQTYAQLAAQVCRSSTIPFDVRIDTGALSSVATQRGKTIVGKPGEHLRSIAKNNNAFVYPDNGVIRISPLTQNPPAIVPKINATNGLIGIPQQVDAGVQFRMLINPDIQLNSWVQLNNQDIVQQQVDFLGKLQTLLSLDGMYRIIQLVISGDTRGNDWYYDVTTINHYNAVPELIASQSQAGI